MTLPELMISCAVLGLVFAVLSAGVTVTLRQAADTHGRVDVARWEQNLGMWLPDDLTSASTVTIDPSDSPCGAGATSCPGVGPLLGSSVLTLQWTENSVVTTVSYRYQPDGGTTYGLFRIECSGGSCSSSRVLSDLSAPVDSLGNPISWTAGDMVPAGIIEVDVPAALDPEADDDLRRVTVTVNGVDTGDGRNRSARVALAAAGAELGALPPPAFTPPTFRRAQSDCGGPITLVVDRSGSIGSTQMGQVRDAVNAFIDTFEGTPTQLQIVDFANYSNALGATSGDWNKYYDLSDPAVADDLQLLVGGLRSNGSTNWEDALFRTLNNSNGTRLVAGATVNPLPELVVFFTDGMPTIDRATPAGHGRTYKSDTASTAMTIDPMFTATTSNSLGVSVLSPRAWYRAKQTVADAGVRIIGVGVGPEFERERKMYDAGGSVLLPGWPDVLIEHEKFIGDLIDGGEPLDLADPADSGFITRRWNDAEGWGDVEDVDLLVTREFSQVATALVEIALAECGGTLTVQTRVEPAGTSAPFELRYHVGVEEITTSRVAKSGTFNIAVGGQPAQVVRLIPDAGQIAGAGYRATGWTCRAGGEDLSLGTDFTFVDGDPTLGIDITIAANAAVACTLEVTR